MSKDFGGILSREELLKLRPRWAEGRRTVVFTNGCFDLLHVGHLSLLRFAWGFGDILVVGINDDLSVQASKGTHRPIVPADERAEMVNALWMVSYVTIFSEPTPLELMQLLRPDVLVKAADWDMDEIVGRDFVEGYGGQVVQAPMVEGHSTTETIRRILERMNA